jgi:hypothetical protein
MSAFGGKADIDGRERRFAALSKFRRQKGHCCPEGKFKLGQWVVTQRYLSGSLSAERKKRLDKIGFIWNWPDFAGSKALLTC